MSLARLVSGGQTGVDRAALDAGRRAGIPIGGWCPLGGWAEDLPEPPGLLAPYPALRSTGSADPALRTRWNVRDSDATLVLVRAGVDSPGTELTVRVAEELGRPHLVADVSDVAAVRDWLVGLPARLSGALSGAQSGALSDGPSGGLVLNVAGPRESEAPGIGREAAALLAAVLTSGEADDRAGGPSDD